MSPSTILHQAATSARDQARYLSFKGSPLKKYGKENGKGKQAYTIKKARSISAPGWSKIVESLAKVLNLEFNLLACRERTGQANYLG